MYNAFFICTLAFGLLHGLSVAVVVEFHLKAVRVVKIIIQLVEGVVPSLKLSIKRRISKRLESNVYRRFQIERSILRSAA